MLHGPSNLFDGPFWGVRAGFCRFPKTGTPLLSISRFCFRMLLFSLLFHNFFTLLSSFEALFSCIFSPNRLLFVCAVCTMHHEGFVNLPTACACRRISRRQRGGNNNKAWNHGPLPWLQALSRLIGRGRAEGPRKSPAPPGTSSRKSRRLSAAPPPAGSR